MLQLPPVKSCQVFRRPNNSHLAAGLDVLRIWEKFKPIVLKQNHRQKDEKDWVVLFNRIRVGIVTDEDVAVLKSLVTTDEFFNQSHKLHLFIKPKVQLEIQNFLTF